MCKVAICQFSPSTNNLTDNFKEIMNQLKKAKKSQANIVVFPELALSGYYNNASVLEFATQIMEEKLIDHIVEQSKKLTIDVVIGYPRLNEKDVYNSTVYVSNGRILGIHDKIYLAKYKPFGENRYFSEGSTVTVIDTQFGKIGLLISEDAWHLSTSLIAAQLGAKLLIICSATAVEDCQKLYMVQYAWETINTAIAFSNSLYLIYSNRSGNENNLAFWGGSHVIDYTGKMMRKAKIFSSDLVYVQLDLAALESAQSEFSRTSEEKNEITVKQLSQEENLIS